MKPVLALARPYLWRLLAAGVLAAAAEAAGLALLATATWLLVTAAGQPPLPALTVAIVLVRALAISRGGLRYTERLVGHDAVLRVLTEVRAQAFATLAGRRRAAPERSGDLLSRVVSDVEAVQDLLLRVIVPGAAALTVAVVAVGGAALVSPPVAAVLAAGLLLAAVGLPLLGLWWVRRAADLVAPLRGEVTADAVDLTHGAADLAAFGATGRATARAADRARRLGALEARIGAVAVAFDAAGTLLAGVTAGAVVAVAMAAGVDGVMVAVLAVAALAAVEVSLALLAAARHWAGIRAPLRRLGELLAEPARAAEAAEGQLAAEAAEGQLAAEAAEDQLPEPAEPVTLACRGLRVRYRAEGPPALAEVDLTLPAGRRVAVVGPSGAGKSTLVAALTGEVEPEAGAVTVNGAPLAAYRPEIRPRLVSGLIAEAHVFHATVRENLLLARPDADPAALAAAVGAAGLGDWLAEQPAGLDTVVGEDGGELSGGQRQRLALARALLAAPAVLVLDEPTEGLDPAAADRVLTTALTAAGPTAAVLLVTHRLHGLSQLDEILVLDGGRVSQRGDHDTLAAAPGWYREQYLAQEAAESGYLQLS